MREFKYNVIDLISYVRDRPCLWDKTIENYKDRMERRSAWEEIFNNLEETYEEMTPEEKRITGDSIVRKWSNMRDSYMKSLRNKPGQGSRKKYMYAKNMKFLIKNATENENDEFNLSDNESSQSLGVSFIQQSLSDDTPTTTPEPFLEFPPTEFVSNGGENSKGSSRQKKKRKEPHAIKKLLLEELQKKSRNDTSARPDEKETMLLSFLPYVKDMNETEMMDFHMDMLTSIRKIKSKRSQIPAACTSSPTESRTPETANSSQEPLTHTTKETPQTKPTPKPPIIKLNPKKTLNFTFPNSQRTVQSYFIQK